MVMPDVFIDQASPTDMYVTAALDADNIIAKVIDVLDTSNST